MKHTDRDLVILQEADRHMEGKTQKYSDMDTVDVIDSNIDYMFRGSREDIARSLMEYTVLLAMIGEDKMQELLTDSIGMYDGKLRELTIERGLANG